MVFKLKPSIQITKGKYRDLLCEVQTQFVSFVPTSLTRFLKEYNGKIDLDALESKYKKSEFYDIYKEYLEYLIENKLLLFTSENKSVQRIKFEYVEKSTFNNMIIYLDFNSDFLNYEKINDIIIKCNIISLELRVINFVDIKKYLSFTTLLNSTYISNIHLVDTKNSVSKYNCQEILERCMKTNKITKFECTSDDIETFINKYGTYNINLKQGSIFDSKFDVKVDNSHANLRYISEALVRNVYFNNKLVIGYDGKIYNNEYLEGCCIGNIFDNNNKLDDKGSDLGIWRVTKGSIKKCKDCELRNLCLDRRTPVVNEKGKYYYASDCGYNLKEGKWDSL